MDALKILGISAIIVMASCTPKEKNPEVAPSQKADSMAVQTSATSHNSKICLIGTELMKR